MTTRTDAANERGAGTILVLALGLLLIAAGLVGAATAGARVGRHEARTAADLGALAGAMWVIEGKGVACAEAERFVTANNGVLTSCDVGALEIVIHVEVTITPMPGITRSAKAAARAGPVSAAAG